MFEDLNYRVLAKRALEAHKHYVDELENNYAARRELRRRKKLPVLAFCGHGRSGKDQSAEFLAANSDVGYVGSVSRYMLPLVAHAMEMDQEECWVSRHDNRNFWREFCDAIRWDDPSKMVRMVLSNQDVVAGIRAKAELWTSWGEGHIDQMVWVHRPGTPDDPTLQYSLEDLIHLPTGNSITRGLKEIWNDGDLTQLETRVRNTAFHLGINLKPLQRKNYGETQESKT